MRMASLFSRRSTRRPRPCVGAFLATALTVATLSPEGRAAAARPGSDAKPAVRTFRSTTSRLQSLDPAKASDVASARAIGLVYECLLQYAYLDRPYRLEPCIAESLPDFSDDGLTCTFRVRAGVRFQDDACFGGDGKGREVTAADLAYAIRRVADPATASPGWWAFRDRIAGLDAWRTARETATAPTADADAPIEGLRTPDARTLEIRLTRPYPQLLWVLAMHYAAAQPREAVEYYGDRFQDRPIGTGPYRLAEHRHNHRLTFERRPDWWGVGLARERERASAPDRCVFHIMDDETTRWMSFLRGDLDIYADISRDNWDAVVTPNGALAPRWTARGIRLHSLPSLSVAYVAFNMDDPVVGRNLKLRQALSSAFDVGQWVRFHNGRVLPARGPIPPGVAGRNDDPPSYPYDPARASALLAEAGFPQGRDPATGRRLELRLELGRTDADTRESTELLVAFFERVGVSLIPSYNNWPAFLQKLARREAQMFRVGWMGDYPDAENFLQLFHGPNVSPGPNRCNYVNPDFDRLFDRARVMPDPERRAALYRELERIVRADAPWIFLHHPVSHTLTHARLRGFAPHAFPYGMEKHFELD